MGGVAEDNAHQHHDAEGGHPAEREAEHQREQRLRDLDLLHADPAATLQRVLDVGVVLANGASNLRQKKIPETCGKKDT